MDAATITCPKCQTTFPLTAAIEQPILDKLKAKFEADTAKKDAALKAREEQLLRQADGRSGFTT